ncbi:hypothetical protein GDO78_011662 [Eleutherodactylus coqui]|uniref:Uncharacterized protein n=1 Tax=Eleutherodactylus coqui TaxID=57060 RepID=A0A8J6F393_ELECQ|nr:hypothetical protein GDO78_011662 [Eleutherodactylus coqui]
MGMLKETHALVRSQRLKGIQRRPQHEDVSIECNLFQLTPACTFTLSMEHYLYIVYSGGKTTDFTACTM